MAHIKVFEPIPGSGRVGGPRRAWPTRLASALAVLSVWGCERGLPPETAATAGDLQLEIEEVAQILSPISSLPNDPEVVAATLDFWIDYTLLAWAVNQEGVLEAIDISTIEEQERSRMRVLRLRDEVVQVDTSITDAELQEAYDVEAPGTEIRARHVLFTLPGDSSPEQADSVRALADRIRDRARSGEDFGGLAEEFSQDPGSSIRGGDLGFFGRGMMVPPFEEAAFALAPGEVSDVVESDFGLHVILVEERRGPTFDDIAEQYRVQLQAERMMQAESIYISGLETPLNVQVEGDATELVRQITGAPEDRLSRSEASSPLTTWEGDRFTAGQYQEFLAGQPRELLQQIVVAQDEQIEMMLRDLTRDRILVAEADRLGIELTNEDEGQIATEIREQYVRIADFLGLDSLEVAGGATLPETIEAEVEGLMGRLVSSEQDIVPLGALALPLRDRFGQRVREDAVELIVARVDELRQAAASGAEPAPSGPTPPGGGAPPSPGAEPD